jgi:DNA polymerase III delta subunit
MITLVIAQDPAVRQKKLAAVLEHKTARGAEVRKYDDAAYSHEALLEIAQSMPLFGGALAVVATGVLDDAEHSDAIERSVGVFAASAHHFIFTGSTAPASLIKKVTAKKGEVIQEKEKIKTAAKDAFNIFSLTDAFAERNRSRAWSLYRSAVATGLDEREIIGKIFWSAKTMLVARDAKSAQDAGLHPFVFQKSKKAANGFGEGELENILYELSVLFHEGTFGGVAIAPAFESFLLRTLEHSSKKVSS